jgi:hypothetical protein
MNIDAKILNKIMAKNPTTHQNNYSPLKVASSQGCRGGSTCANL